MSGICVNCSIVLQARPRWQHFCSADCYLAADQIPKPVDRALGMKNTLELLTAETRNALKQLIRECVQSGVGTLLITLLCALTQSIEGGALVDAVEPGWKQVVLLALTAGEVTSVSLMLLRAIFRDESIKKNPAAILLAIKRFPETSKNHPRDACSAIFNAISTVSNKDVAFDNPAFVKSLCRILESGSNSVVGTGLAVIGRFAAGVGSRKRIEHMMPCLDKLMELAIKLPLEGTSHLFADLGLAARNCAMALEVEHLLASNPQFVKRMLECALAHHELASETLCVLINIGMNPKVREYFVANLDAAAFGKIAMIIMRHARQPDLLIKWFRFLSNLFGVKDSSCPQKLRERACAPMLLPEDVINEPPADDARVCASGYELRDFGPAPDLEVILRAIEELIAALAHTPDVREVRDVREVMRMATALIYTVFCFDNALGMELMRQMGKAALGGAAALGGVAALGGAARIDADLQMSIKDCAEGKLNPASLLGLLGTKPVVVERAVRWPDVHKALEGCGNLVDVLITILKLNIEDPSVATSADDVVFAYESIDFDELDASAQHADGLRLTAPRPGGLGPVQPTWRKEVVKWGLHVLDKLTRDCQGAEAAPLRECRKKLMDLAATIGCVRDGTLNGTLMAILVTQLPPSGRQQILAARKAARKAAQKR